MTSVNWNEVLSEVGIENVRAFCNGCLTRRDFESFGGSARRLVRTLGAQETRSRARKALTRRNVSV